MLELVFNFVPGLLALYKTPMSPAAKHWWEKCRRFGCAFFVTGVALGLGGGATIVDVCWDLLVDHQAIGGPDIKIRFIWWLSGALIVGLGEWILNESRFRLPPKPIASNVPCSAKWGSTAL
jgi:hypothetical protein